MSAWSGGRVLLLETNVEVQAHRPPLRKSSENESGPVLNEITGSDPVIQRRIINEMTVHSKGVTSRCTSSRPHPPQALWK